MSFVTIDFRCHLLHIVWMHALEVTDLRKTYKNGVEALKGVSLTVQEGDFFALLGGSLGSFARAASQSQVGHVAGSYYRGQLHESKM